MNITIRLQCHGHYSEVIMDDLEDAALFLEQLIGLLLQEIFEIVIIDGVVIQRAPFEAIEDTSLPDCI
ncbi:MAG TPA: hypothetical protein VFQ30_03795 [Ktedonobacteraceae bacterium]|nr:hypothetical protein [Ktedonobacteraceae bacterium]